MNKRISGAKLGRKKAHREAMIRNQVRSLFDNGFLVTTTPKAKALKGVVESFLSKIRENTLEDQRKMHEVLGNKNLVDKTRKFLEGKNFKVSIVKIGFRDGDNAETSKITLVGYSELFGKKDAKRKVSEKKRTKKKGETEFIEAKQRDEIVENPKVEKVVKKEKARSRSGI